MVSLSSYKRAPILRPCPSLARIHRIRHSRKGANPGPLGCKLQT